MLEKERDRRLKLRKERQEAGILHKPRKVEKKTKKTVRGDHFKTRFRKTFDLLIDEEEQRLKKGLKDENEKIISYKTYGERYKIVSN